MRPATFDELNSERSIQLQHLVSRDSQATNSSDAEEDELDLISQYEPGDDAPLISPISKGTNVSPAEADKPRNIVFGGQPSDRFPSNAITHAKYNAITFLPYTLFEQFKFFFNLYFLLVALSQFIPSLRIGFLSTYVAPLIFVLSVTMAKEALDDVARRKRDAEANSELYELLLRQTHVQSKDIKVGDIIRVEKDRRIPADIVLLQTLEGDGEAFVRTDQLDGETDWKLKLAPPVTQKLPTEKDVLQLQASILADPPTKSIHSFFGNLILQKDGHRSSYPLSVDNALWANTVLASGGSILGVVIFTGIETRQALNTSKPRAKVGLLEQEINQLSKILCALTLLLSVALVAFHGFHEEWYVDITKFLILFSTIIPISLRVNLDLGKTVYARQIENDETIRETIVRTSTIPEDLGRIDYLLTDKTGTLTKNEMEMKKLHIGTVCYTGEAMGDIASFVDYSLETALHRPQTPQRSRREIGPRVQDVVMALAICHNVTPTTSFDDHQVSYQAASPDELAIVKWTETVGLALIGRDRHSLRLQRQGVANPIDIAILQIFPFTSETKRMGIVVRVATGQVVFYEKGADVVMQNIVAPNDWLEEECGNMAREGLRTLVIGKKNLTNDEYSRFKSEYDQAALSMHQRDTAMARVVSEHLESNLQLLGITGVEDKLQDSVKSALEFLRNAGIRIWMLTGDKVETARCIAVSAKLVARGQYVHTIIKLQSERAAMEELEVVQTKLDACLLIDGDSLQFYLDHFQLAFIQAATKLSAVICCRCSPTQKADVARLIIQHTKKRVCCIGDGGNDVSMIQAADVGIGIVGKEGRQASLAADFSVPEFSHLMKLLVWHGRNSYKRSAKLAQFVIHRGLLISICQIVYSVTSKFAPIALYQGWLMVGYATAYTMAPVFSLVLDIDLDESLVQLYPELYKELTEGSSLSYKTFLTWVLVSVYQGVAIMVVTNILVGTSGPRMVSVSFTAIVINELVMVALEINTWHPIMIYSELATFLFYFLSLPLLGDYYDLQYVASIPFVWKTALITAISLLPPWAVRYTRRRLRPPNYIKVSGTA